MTFGLIDNLLRKWDVDVCRCLAVLSFVEGLTSLQRVFFSCVAQKPILDLTFFLCIFIASALWQRKRWARMLEICWTWLGGFLLLLSLGFLLFTEPEQWRQWLHFHFPSADGWQIGPPQIKLSGNQFDLSHLNEQWLHTWAIVYAVLSLLKLVLIDLPVVHSKKFLEEVQGTAPVA